ncbi:MAG: type 2 isopentenyl-diphosphate Delta-isomerase [Thermococci archaeon]|nr:type 2 isopentenyl-diphosphate Delta-isomerase [Thermococci archaeon]
MDGDNEARLTLTRKLEHIELCLREDVQAHVSNGFEDVHLVHNSLPEIDRDEVDLSVEFLGRRFDYPIMIAGMTGGAEEAARINKTLARAAQELNIPMGVGSQRAMLKRPETWESYYVRDVAPDVFLIGNLGAPQFSSSARERYGVDEARKAVEKIQADALAIHLNPLQESVQPEGDTTYRGVLQALAELKAELPYPVIAKETGAGVSKEVAVRLEGIGIDAVDVGGLGGTSWSAVEYYRTKDELGRKMALRFWDWGIKTAVSVAEVSYATDLPIIATGGMRDGVTMAKALAMGATMVGVALPLLRPAVNGDVDGVLRILRMYIEEIRNTMFLVGARNVEEFRRIPLVITGFTREWLEQRIELAEYMRSR